MEPRRFPRRLDGIRNRQSDLYDKKEAAIAASRQDRDRTTGPHSAQKEKSEPISPLVILVGAELLPLG